MPGALTHVTLCMCYLSAVSQNPIDERNYYLNFPGGEIEAEGR